MKSLFFILYFFLSLTLIGQDFQLTQFYANPTYLNPALTGSNSDTRIIASYRNQWPGLPGSFNTFLISADHYLHRFHSGVGIVLTKDKAGSMGLGTNSAGFNYAFDYRLNQYWSAAIGIRFSYFYRSLDFNKLVFGDQIVRDASTSIQNSFPEKIHFFDFSSGLILFSSNTWFGFSVDHVLTPNESFLGKTADLPLKGSVHGGKNIYLEKVGSGQRALKPYFMVAFNYKYQEKFDQLDLGVYLKQPKFFIGLWYRGIPLFKQYAPGYANNDALAILVGGPYKKATISYSYDLTISRLAGTSGGSHEISVTYYIHNPKKPKKTKKKIIPCPDII